MTATPWVVCVTPPGALPQLRAIRRDRLQSHFRNGLLVVLTGQDNGPVNPVTGGQKIESVVWNDRPLSAPRLLLPSMQVNMRAGRLPPAEANVVRYLIIPVKEPEGSL